MFISEFEYLRVLISTYYRHLPTTLDWQWQLSKTGTVREFVLQQCRLRLVLETIYGSVDRRKTNSFWWHVVFETSVTISYAPWLNFRFMLLYIRVGIRGLYLPYVWQSCILLTNNSLCLFRRGDEFIGWGFFFVDNRWNYEFIGWVFFFVENRWNYFYVMNLILCDR